MNKIVSIIAMVALMCSCSEEVLKEGVHSSASKELDTAFSFDSITDPNVWASFNSLEEMLAACQIPNDKLKSMTTDELIEVCMSHPLHALYFAYNNELDGAKVVFDHFNGFSELGKRANAAERILAFYNDINFNANATKAHKKDFTNITYMGFVELYLSSKELSSLYEGENLRKLEQISNKVLEKKLKQPSAEIFAIRRSLLISAQTKLAEGSLSKDEESLLKSFVEAGGYATGPQTYSKVSAIVSQ